MERGKCSSGTNVYEAEVIPGARRVVRVHPVIAEDVWGGVERFEGLFACGIGGESVGEMPILDIERFAPGLFPQGDYVAEEHVLASLVAGVTGGAVGDCHLAVAIVGLETFPVDGSVV